MPQNYFKPIGATKESKPDAGGGVIRSVPVLGVVKNNIDAVRSGRLQVYISDFGAPDPDDSSSWTTVGMMVPFFGNTEASGGTDTYGSYTENPSSYGMWYSPPDIGSIVICIFINGDMSYGYYIGGVPKPEVLQMVPAIGSSENVTLNEGEAKSLGGSTKLPTTNLNTNNPAITNSAGFINEAKPVHSFSASIYTQQGLIRDPIRGPVSSSALRESPSRVGWGVSTPGRPIFQGGYNDDDIISKGIKGEKETLAVIARRGGHSIVMDDGTILGKDQLIRLRTALGHQILMSDDGQCLHIIHSNGQSWIELGKEGTIDMYSTNSVNIRTQGDLNLHADNNININAKKDLNIAADNININAEKNIAWRAGGNFSGYTIGKYTIKVTGAMSMAAAGEGSYASSGIMYVNGSKINLNTGSTSVTPAEVPLIPLVAHADTLSDPVKGYAAAPGKLLSVVSRAPAHAPWANANQGVDVKVSNNASSELPTPPPPAVAATNNSTPATPTNPTSTANASTVPVTEATSKALDKNVTGSMVSGVATQAAAANPEVVTSGSGVITDATGQVNAAVGKLAMTPQQMETAGVLKTGSAALVTGLVQSGSTVKDAMTDNLFTGKPGAETLAAFTQNIPAQVSAQVQNFQQAQTSLQQSGLITGNESPAVVAGLVNSVSQVGLSSTTDFVKNAASTNNITGVTSALAAAAGGVPSAVSNAIAGGKSAANLATNATGGLSSIALSLSGLSKSASEGLSGVIDAAKGIAGSAFSAITASFKAFKPGVPQDLKAIAKGNAEAQAKTEAAAATPIIADAAASVTAATAGVASGAAAIASSVGVAAGTPTTTAGATVISPSSITNSIASGVNALPGGAGAVSSLVNSASGAVNKLPSLAGVSGVASNASAAAVNGISSATSVASSLVSASAGRLPSLASLTGSAIPSIPSSLSALSDKIAGGQESLTALVSAGLPAGASAQLQSNISALSAAGPVSIKLPTVATNTVDRGEITSQINSLLGDPKIPRPNFSGLVANPSRDLSQAELDTYDGTSKEIATLADSRFDLSRAVANARYALSTAKQDLPQGDPAISTLEQAVATAKNNLDELDKKLLTARNKLYTLTTGKPPPSSTTVSA
jgi:hypothetical protein